MCVGMYTKQDIISSFSPFLRLFRVNVELIVIRVEDHERSTLSTSNVNENLWPRLSRGFNPVWLMLSRCLPSFFFSLSLSSLLVFSPFPLPSTSRPLVIRGVDYGSRRSRIIRVFMELASKRHLSWKELAGWQ